MIKPLPVSKRRLGVFAASSLLCMLTMVSVSALAQENRLEVNIPFDFNVGKTAEVNAAWIPATTWPSASQKIVVLPQVNAAWIPATTWPSASQKIVVLPHQ
jgi:hypothetical protein